ncbi:TRAF family member-associated NF-kappa-B activator-like [Gastrophryne carolinensis]
MEDAFLELYQQFKLLQVVCIQQTKLLQRLLSKDPPTTEKPISKPIQCTDAGDPTCSESPFFRLTGMGTSTKTSKTRCEEVSKPLEKVDNSSHFFSFEFDVQFPPNANSDQYSFLANQLEKELASGISKSDVSLEKFENNSKFEFLFLNNDTPTIPKHDFLPANTDYSLSNIYEELYFLQPFENSAKNSLEPQIKNSSDIRGPAQSSWSPGCLSDECQLFLHEDNNSDVALSSQICEFCQAVFPAGAATKSEYLQHITGHIE